MRADVAWVLVWQVGMLSDVYVQIASLTANATWLQAAALFDRRCFSAPLALAGAMHAATATEAAAEGARPFAQGAAEGGGATAGMRGLHANAAALNSHGRRQLIAVG